MLIHYRGDGYSGSVEARFLDRSLLPTLPSMASASNWDRLEQRMIERKVLARLRGAEGGRPVEAALMLLLFVGLGHRLYVARW